MNFEKIVNIYNNNRQLNFESFLNSLSLETGNKIDPGTIHWFSKDVMRKNSVSRPIKIVESDGAFSFFNSDGSCLFKLSSETNDYTQSFFSPLRTCLFPFIEDKTFILSNDQFIAGQYGLYEDYSKSKDFSSYRYLTFDDSHHLNYETFVDFSKNTMKKNYYKKNGEVDSKFSYDIYLKNYSTSELSKVADKVTRFVDENFSNLSFADKNKLFYECVDGYFYDIKLSSKTSNYNEIYATKKSTVYSDETSKSYLDSSHIAGVQNNNLENSFFSSNWINSDIQLLCLSDFVNGSMMNKKLTNFPINELNSWFQRLELDTLKDDSLLLKGFESKISAINKHLIEEMSKYRKKHSKKTNNRVIGSAFAATLVGNDKTFIFNCGDTRIYSVKGDNLIPLTCDDTVVWDMYKEKRISKVEAFQFQKNAKLTKYLGCSNDNLSSVFTIDNDDYDTLLLLSDGVTDHLNDSTIHSIISVNKNEDLLKEIIFLANLKQVQHDDVTGCCYIKSKR